jgi:hypothetical protein
LSTTEVSVTTVISQPANPPRTFPA